MIIYLKKRLNGLYPVDSINLDLLHKLGNDTLKCKITKPRNVGHHRKYWALVHMTYENLPHDIEGLFKSPQQLHTELKLQAGLYEVHKTIGGKEIPQVKSIKFGSMDQTEFEIFYDSCIKTICKYILPGITSEEIRNNLLDF